MSCESKENVHIHMVKNQETLMWGGRRHRPFSLSGIYSMDNKHKIQNHNFCLHMFKAAVTFFFKGPREFKILKRKRFTVLKKNEGKM